MTGARSQPKVEPVRQHTPTPWQISPVRTTEDTAMIVGGEGFEFGLIADVTEDFDAAFIVETVNSHGALTERVSELEKAIRLAVEELGWGEFDQARRRLRAALPPIPGEASR